MTIGMKIRISDFERLTGVSSATLRYYDSLGVLCARRNSKNNYRTYDAQDVLRLIQLRQIQAFGIPLGALSPQESDVSCEGILGSLTQRQKEIEQSIEEMYRLLERIKLHANSYQRAAHCDSAIVRTRMVGTYRLFLSDPEVASHRNTPEIFQRWIAAAPHVYSVIRIRYAQLSACKGGTCPADMGIGLFKRVFDSIGDTFREPMVYSPVNTCINTMIETPDPTCIPVSALRPMLDYVHDNGLIPLDDLFGWVVYTPIGEEDRMYRISLRLAVAGV